MAHQINIQLPPRCAVNLLPNNGLRLHFEGATVVALQQALLGAASRLLETAIASVQQQKTAELARQQLPASRLDMIDQELAKLTTQRAELVANLPPSAIAPPEMPEIVPSEPMPGPPSSPQQIGQELLAQALGAAAHLAMGASTPGLPPPPAPAAPGTPNFLPTVNPGEMPTAVKPIPYNGPLF